MSKKRFEIEKEQLEKYFAMHMTYKEIADIYGCSHWTVMERAKEYGMKSEARRHQMRTDNPAAKKEVAEKISNTIKDMWEQGVYDGRVNGMLGRVGEQSTNFVKEGTKTNYRDKAKHYHPEAVCLNCGKQLSWDDNSIEVHHVDGNHDNFALSNLQPLCHSCHRKYHRKSQPIVIITKNFVFDSCHFLPYHDGKCKFLHGHTYHMEVSVKNRVLQETGMVMDFGKLKKVVNENVVNLLDHAFFNHLIKYPTCEFMIYWVWSQLSKDIKGLYRIRLWETDGSYAELTADMLNDYIKEFEADWRVE